MIGWTRADVTRHWSAAAEDEEDSCFITCCVLQKEKMLKIKIKINVLKLVGLRVFVNGMESCREQERHEELSLCLLFQV